MKLNVEFIKELDGNYLVVEGLRQSGFECRMLQYGKPSGLLGFRLFRDGEKISYHYEISGKQSLSYLTQTSQIDERQIREILYSIYRCCEEAELHLLRPSGLLLEPGLIFRGKEGWFFMYHPDLEEDLFVQMQRISRFFLRKCNQEDERTSRIAYELLRVCHEENTSFSQIFELWEEESPMPQPMAEQKQKRKKARGLFRKNKG